MNVEKILKQAEKERRAAERIKKASQKLVEKEKKNIEKEERQKIKQKKLEEKLAKQEERKTTEKDLVHRYASRVMNNQKYHGRVDAEKFKNLAYEKKVNKNLWLDSDFYFSVVFESVEQKHDFLLSLGLSLEDVDEAKISKRIGIVNGIKFAEKLGISLKREDMAADYPLGNLDLRPYVLDNEVLDD